MGNERTVLSKLQDAFEHVREAFGELGNIPFPLEQGILLVGGTGEIVYATDRLGEMIGLPAETLTGTSVADLAVRLGVPDLASSTFTVHHSDGGQRVLRRRSVALVALDGSATGTLHVFHDTTAATERARQLAEKSRQLDEARAHLAQAQHLKAVGELAAEVGHEFGNLLQAIGLQAAALRHQPALPEVVMSSLRSIKQAIDLGQAMTRRLLTFARDEPETALIPTDIGRVLRDLVELLEPRLRRGGIPLRITLSVPTLPEVRVDQAKLTQAFLNLFLNAIDAMPEGGTLEVSAVERSGEVRIAVRDSGRGMSTEELNRAFDPFFTTKPGGTGLGLSTAYGVIRAHGGSVFLESEPGRGTTAFVSLPSAASPPLPETIHQGHARCDAGRVLVVDDHPTVRIATSALLAAQGYEVESAATVADALTAIESRRFAVIVTDLRLPDRPGWEVARAAKQASPETVVVLVSGWRSQFSMDEARARGVDLVFEKPIDPDVLLSAINHQVRPAQQNVARPPG